MAHQSRLKSEKYRQWVKAGLGLGYLKEGLAPFCDDVAKQQHKDILDNIKQTKNIPSVVCGTCFLKTLQPDHVKRGNKQCPLGHTNCNCCYTSGKNPCPNNVCGTIYDSIISYHASTPPAPIWKNTQTQQWTADPWSIAKCFINAPGYEQKTSAADTDCTGLLHVIINNKYFHNHVSCNMTGPNIFSKVRQYRNEIFHSSTMELDSTKTNSYIDDMIAVLQDGKELIHRPDAKEAVKKLQDMKQEAFIITTEDVEKLFGDIRDDLSLIMNTTEGLVKDIEDQKRKLANLESIISELKEDTSANKKREYDLSKADLQKKLIKEYRENLLQVSVMPCQQEHLYEFKDVYVRPKITIKSKYKDKKDIVTELKNMSDIFIKDGNPLKSIYILGEAGSGKSSFCKRIVYCWCMAHSSTQHLDGLKAEVNTEDHVELLQIMKNFNFLFFLPLCHCADQVSIKNMLEEEYEHLVLKELLERESETCLIVLDGLDEWAHGARFPPRRAKFSNFTVITTSRPWKIGSLEISDNEMQQSIHINGFDFDSKNKMISKTVNILNKTFKKDKDPQHFARVLENEYFFSLTPTAMMIQQLICLWFDDKLDATSKCNLHTCMLDLFFVWYKKKVPNAPLFEGTFNEQPKCKLPENLYNTDECKLHSFIIEGVSRLAYETLLRNEKETSLTFDRSMFHRLGLSDKIGKCLFELGILSEEKGPSLSASKSRKSHISFIQKSMQEYLAAVYIVLNMKTEQKSLGTEDADLSHYLKMLNVKNGDELLEQENVLTMLCGLDFRVARSISKFIYETVSKDDCVVKYRKTIEIDNRDVCSIHNIQNLILNCIEETRRSYNLPQFSFDVGDLVLDRYQNLRLFRGVTELNIKLDTVISFYTDLGMLKKGEYDGRIIDYMTKCKSLEAIKVVCIVDEEVHRQICDSIEKSASTLKCLSVRNSEYSSSPLRKPLIRRLANIARLVALQIEYFSMTHGDITSLCNFLSGTGNLQQISIYIQCECNQQHKVDLSKHKQLQYLQYNKSFVVTNAEFTNLEVINCSLDEKHHSNVLDFLSKTTKLKEITFDSDSSEVRNLLDIGNMSGQDNCHFSVTSKLTNVLSSSKKLRQLTLKNISFTDNIIKCPSGMKSLKMIYLNCGTMSLTTWRKFVDSVVLLPQAVKVISINMRITRDGEERYPHSPYFLGGGGEEVAAFHYVREHDSLCDVSDPDYIESSILFSTKK